MSALFQATARHANAAARACQHALRGCDICPKTLAQFLYRSSVQQFCEAGWKLVAEIRDSEVAIAEAVATPEPKEQIQ
jgi:hypothetical protein